MPEKNLFGMLEEISVNQTALLDEIAGVKGKVNESDLRIANMLETRKSGIKKINANFSFEFSQKCSKVNGK